ncbi:hypothetical protein FQR65_LT20974 [Abscondita terminalis]|nr:hypothetical protein FQR65_LT20974 [Abscondita terminalis]
MQRNSPVPLGELWCWIGGATRNEWIDAVSVGFVLQRPGHPQLIAGSLWFGRRASGGARAWMVAGYRRLERFATPAPTLRTASQKPFVPNCYEQWKHVLASYLGCNNHSVAGWRFPAGDSDFLFPCRRSSRLASSLPHGLALLLTEALSGRQPVGGPNWRAANNMPSLLAAWSAGHRARRALAERLMARLLCQSPQGLEACGRANGVVCYCGPAPPGRYITLNQKRLTKAISRSGRAWLAKALPDCSAEERDELLAWPPVRPSWHKHLRARACGTTGAGVEGVKQLLKQRQGPSQLAEGWNAIPLLLLFDWFCDWSNLILRYQLTAGCRGLGAGRHAQSAGVLGRRKRRKGKPPMLIDSHCHLDRLDLAAHDGSLDAALEAARRRGVGHFLCIGVSADNAARVKALAERYEDVDCSRVVAIGENGAWITTIEPQAALFAAGVLFVCTCKRPSARQAVSCIPVAPGAIPWRCCARRPLPQGRGPALLHRRTGTMAKAALVLGFYYFPLWIVTLSMADALRDVARQVPAERLLGRPTRLILPPFPYRGKPNLPPVMWRDVSGVFGDAARRGLIEAFAAQTTANFSPAVPVGPCSMIRRAPKLATGG